MMRCQKYGLQANKAWKNRARSWTELGDAHDLMHFLLRGTLAARNSPRNSLQLDTIGKSDFFAAIR